MEIIIYVRTVQANSLATLYTKYKFKANYIFYLSYCRCWKISNLELQQWLKKSLHNIEWCKMQIQNVKTAPNHCVWTLNDVQCLNSIKSCSTEIQI